MNSFKVAKQALMGSQLSEAQAAELKNLIDAATYPDQWIAVSIEQPEPLEPLPYSPLVNSPYFGIW